MEIIWRKGVGMKFAIKPRSLMIVASLVFSLTAPTYITGWIELVKAVLAAS